MLDEEGKPMRKENTPDNLSTVSIFVRKLMELKNTEKGLRISISKNSVFDLIDSFSQEAIGFDWYGNINDSDKFDFILGDFPLGMSPKNFDFGVNNLRIPQNWVEILKSLKLLNENGASLYPVEPTCFGSLSGKKFEDALNSEGYFVNAIFNTPKEILHQETLITPVLVLISKKKTNSIFIAELLNESQASELAQRFYSGAVGNDLIKGMEIQEKTFYGFDRVKIKLQIERLETQYKEYEQYTIREIAKEINHVMPGCSLTEKDNSIYIPRIAFLPIVTRLEHAIKKHHNYYQVVIGEKAINEYVTAFFRSALGRLVLQSVTSEATIQKINKADLEQLPIALPSLDDQMQILETQRKLMDLKNSIDIFESELALNPTDSISILDQLDRMTEVIYTLTEADRIRNIIRQGESKNTEFKQTLSLDVKKQTKENYIEHAVIKTINAFLNTDGGTLLVGVADNGEITGVDYEIEKFYNKIKDRFLQHMKGIIKKNLGLDYFDYINYEFVDMGRGKKILEVKCEKSPSPCFLDTNEFYVRTNPASDKLEGKKLIQYIKNHFDR